MKFNKLFLLVSTLPMFLNCNNKTYVTLTFDPKNGDPIKIIKLVKGTKATKIDNPTKKKCKFVDWYDNNNIKWDFDLNSINKDTVLAAKYEVGEDFDKDEVEPEKKHENANLRVMSFNVLTEKYNNCPQHKGENEKNEKDNNCYRDRDMLETVDTYKPDVVGFQELDYIANNYINDANSDYVLVNKDKFVDDENPREVTEKPSTKKEQKDSSYYNAIFSTIAYNKNTVTLLDYELKYNAELSDNHDCRYLMLAAFKHNATDRKFIVTSTHWNLSSLTPKEKREGTDTLAKKAEKNLKQAKQSVTWTLDYQKRHGGIPVITTGDYNAREFRETYNAFLEGTNFQDTKYTAKSRGLVCDTSHIGNGNSYEPDRWYRGIISVNSGHVSKEISIDHIFASKSIVPIYYDTISTTKALNCSDHMPIYCDFIY